VVNRRTTSWVAGIGVFTLIAVLSLVAVRTERPVASPSPTVAAVLASPTATTAASPPTTSPLLYDSYQTGDTPIVAPWLSGRWLRVALDAVRPGQSGHNRWALRMMLAGDAPANAEVRLNAAVTGPNGALETFGFSAGPPNAGDATVQQSIVLAPCGSRPPVGVASGVVVLSVETSPVISGTYTITLRDLRRPEGDTVNESWTVALTCTLDPGPARPQATNCR
jgi:hypothetical protein